jgi:hypothetical protein
VPVTARRASDRPTGGTRVPLIDPARLTTPIALRRYSEGVWCFARPLRWDEVEAICVDFGLTARGRTFQEADRELRRVIEDTLRAAADTGHLYDLLNAPDNREAAWQQKITLAAFRVAGVLLLPVQWFAAIRAYQRRMVSATRRYSQALPTAACA